MLKEFKDFISKGNVIDLAVAVIIGGAFGAIINSLVNDIIMPPVGRLLSGINFTDLFINMSGGTFKSLDEAKKAGAATINYGLFLNTIINFIIIAFVLFLVIRAITRMKKAEVQKTPEAPVSPAPSNEEVLLTEIRDLLKQQANK
jgi:large conductance mechanosensitive channel